MNEAPRDECIRAERGASSVEYALLLALIALFCFGAVVTLGGKTGSTYDMIADSVASAN